MAVDAMKDNDCDAVVRLNDTPTTHTTNVLAWPDEYQPLTNTEEARRLLAKGYKLCKLAPFVKRPEGAAWNVRPVEKVEDGKNYGLILAASGLCSIDPDNVEPAREGLTRCGFDLEQLMNAGCRTKSTRPGSGGRSIFLADPRLRKIVFRSRTAGTILELRASDGNLQDTISPLSYLSIKSDPAGNPVDVQGPFQQEYASAKRLDDAGELPPDFLAWWVRLSTDLDFRHSQERLFVGEGVQVSVSCGGVLAFESPHRGTYNDTHDVESILMRHGYHDCGRGRYSPPNATGSPGIRAIPRRDGLWQSDHASDPLSGTFDAWSAYVVLDHQGDQEAAEAEFVSRQAPALVEGFDNVPILENAPPPLPNFKRTANGDIKSTRTNLHFALLRPDICGVVIQRDHFKGEIVLTQQGSDVWKPLADPDYSAIGIALERQGFQTMTTQAIREAVLFAAEKNATDSAQTWLASRKWDGVPRVEKFLTSYLRTAATPYTHAVSRYIWTALAGRVLSPGVKADMAPVLVGAQGAGKSTAVAALSPDPDFFGEIDLGTRDEDIGRAMRGKLVMELAELRGLKTREAEAIKAFISRTHDEWVPKYMEHAVKQPRRCLFFGTSNVRDFLADDTGNRRWLPFEVGECDVLAIKQDLDQLWAEGAAMFNKQGVMYEEAETLAAAEHDAFSEQDEWAPIVKKWLYRCDMHTGKSPFHRPYLTTAEVLIEAIEMPKERITPKGAARITRILKAEGYASGYAPRPLKARVMFPPDLFNGQ